MNWLYKLSPSDFAFLWEQCKCCFYLKVVHHIKPPSMPMASIFKRIEGLQMKFYDGRPTREVSPDLPPGTMRCGEKWVESEVIRPPGHRLGCYMVGKLDSYLELEGGGWGVLDFKTSSAKGNHLTLYSRQLHAYAYALERPSSIHRRNTLQLSPITKLGLVCFEPSSLALPGVGRHSYEGDVKWIELEREDEKFMEFISQVIGVLDQPSPPKASPSCPWCAYRSTSRASGL